MRRGLPVLATTIVAIIGIVLVERIDALRGARTIESGLVFVWLAVCGWASRGRLRDTLLVLCSLVFGLALLEALAPTLLGGKTAPQRTAIKSDAGLAGERPIVGWGPLKPGVYPSVKATADGHLIWDTNVTIDDHLNRKTIPGGPRPIAFFGDSWIYGDGVNDDGTIPQAFADATGRKIPVLNLSFAGWGPSQNLAALQKGLYQSLLDRPRHFILFTATFHVERTACRNDYSISQSPRFVPDGDTVKYVGACADSHSFLAVQAVRLARRFALYDRIAPRFTAPTREDIETYIKVLEAFVVTAKTDYHVQTTILFAPFNDRYIKGSGYTDRQIIETLRKSGVDVLVDHLPDVQDESVYWIPLDGHPTPFANRIRAKEILAHLQKVDPTALVTDEAAMPR